MRRIALALTLLATPALAQTQVQDRAVHNDLWNWGAQIVGAIKAIPAPAPAPDYGPKLDAIHADLAAILAQLKAAPPVSGGTTPPVVTPPVVTSLNDPCKGRTGKWDTLAITPADSIPAALVCANPGFKLALGAGTYRQTFDLPAGLDGFDLGPGPGLTAADVKLDGGGGCLVNGSGQQKADDGASACTTRLAWGKATLHLSSIGTVHDLELTGGGHTTGGHDGQAGAYVESASTGLMTFRRVMFRSNQNGAFSNPVAANVDTVFELCDFVGNAADGGSHSTYMGGGKSVTYLNSNDYGSLHGNNWKTRLVPKVTVQGGYNASREGRWVECAEGCTLTISDAVLVGNTCCQNMLGNADEASTLPATTTIQRGSLWIARNSVVNGKAPLELSGVTVAWGAAAAAFHTDQGAASPMTIDGAAAATLAPPAGAAIVPAPAAPPFASGAK